MTTTGKIDLEQGGQAYSVLKCPNCGGEYLHHSTTRTYDRGADAPETLLTVAGEGEAKTSLVPSLEADNPSARRHGVVIGFDCESCGDGVGELTIAQHKGQTMVSWRLPEME